MTGQELRNQVAAIGWTLRTLAERANVRPTTVQRWAMDRQPIPAPIADWLVRLAQFHAANPAPRARARVGGQ